MYVDGVFSGGGIKGLAYAGAYEVLEQKGFRFIRVAGTSAGSIVAALIAAGYSSKEIYDELDQLDMNEILDHRKLPIPGKICRWLPIFWTLGLYKGDALERWLEEILLRKGIKNFSDLPPGTLKIVASDLTNGRILVLPDDLYRYNIPYESFSIAKAVRMSCSLPYFFEPVRLKTGKRKTVIVDGGVLSNFPIWLFDQENKKKKRPVIGIKLSSSEHEEKPRTISNALQMFEALFLTMKDAHDARYISKRHAKNIIFIPIEGILAAELALSESKKADLVQFGREQTEKFLQKWSY